MVDIGEYEWTNESYLSFTELNLNGVPELIVGESDRIAKSVRNPSEIARSILYWCEDNQRVRTIS